MVAWLLECVKVLFCRVPHWKRFCVSWRIVRERRLYNNKQSVFTSLVGMHPLYNTSIVGMHPPYNNSIAGMHSLNNTSIVDMHPPYTTSIVGMHPPYNNSIAGMHSLNNISIDGMHSLNNTSIVDMHPPYNTSIVDMHSPYNTSIIVGMPPSIPTTLTSCCNCRMFTCYFCVPLLHTWSPCETYRSITLINVYKNHLNEWTPQNYPTAVIKPLDLMTSKVTWYWVALGACTVSRRLRSAVNMAGWHVWHADTIHARVNDRFVAVFDTKRVIYLPTDVAIAFHSHRSIQDSVPSRVSDLWDWRVHVPITRALFRLERTMNVLCH